MCVIQTIKKSNYYYLFTEEQVYRLKKENEDLQRLSERLRDHLEKSRAQLDFHHRNGCSIDHLEVFFNSYL